MQHVINKQTILVNLLRSQDAFHIQQQLSEHYRNDVIPVLDQLFDEISTEEESLYIDALEVDLGVLTEKEIFDQNWSDELRAAIRAQVLEKITAQLSGTPKSVQPVETAVGVCMQWLYYMKKGYLPWNALQISKKWRQTVLEALAKDHLSISALRDLILTDERALKRIVLQHDETFLMRLAEILTAASQQHLPQLLSELEVLYGMMPKNEPVRMVAPEGRIRQVFWLDVFLLSAVSEIKMDHKRLVINIISKHMSPRAKQVSGIAGVSENMPLLQPIIREWSQMATGEDAEMQPFADSYGKEVNANSGTPQDMQRHQESEGIFVQHAGLVLLHPFLGIFFNRLSLVSKGKFVDGATHQKALYLLHYLCTGASDAEECDLVIPKILCGYPLSQPVERNIDLSDSEKEQGDHLLEETIRQWAILKNSSPDALRHGFLQRNGKLLSDSDNIRIVVEAQAIDILLDQLPWNLSIIKMPWMRHIIRVDWR